MQISSDTRRVFVRDDFEKAPNFIRRSMAEKSWNLSAGRNLSHMGAIP